MLGWKSWRRRRALAKASLDEATWQRVAGRFSFVLRLDAEAKRRLRDLCILFVHEKQISAASGFTLTLEMKLGIAIQACILILQLGRGVNNLNHFDGWVEIIVYPGQFLPRQELRGDDGIIQVDESFYAGQAWLQGPVILSWEDVENAGDLEGTNVVIHEFAHKLDMLNGEANGFPPLHADMSREAWTQAFTAAFEDLCRSVDAGERTDIDPYASESPAEFFAVLSEAFFEVPELVKEIYPKVYEQMTLFYRQDPASRELPREWRLRRA